MVKPARYIAKKIDINGTGLQGEVRASYADLVRLFGPPNCEGDEYKVSTEWTVLDTSTDAVLTIYDYKATNLYDDKSAPSVEAFRALPDYDWHIGAGNVAAATAFIAWLRAELEPLRLVATEALKPRRTRKTTNPERKAP